MKACSNCQRLYPEDAGFCPIEGTPLAPVTAVAVPADPEDKRIGAAICRGRYEIRRKVADGGMGRVYQALDRQAQRSVAIKVLHPEVAIDEVQVERFKREYAFSSKLPHDHIVEVLDFQTTEDRSYALVMEYLEGEELRQYLQRESQCSPQRMIRVLSQLAIGLEKPHELKFVHRDIKPDNIFLCGTEDGPRVKLLDFGSVRDNSEGAKKLTVVGTTIGSPYYMSPEQAQGLPDLDHRADIWALAAITYEALTGQVPFYGTSGPQILLAILGHEPEPPSILANADGFKGNKIPEAVDDVITDALTKDHHIRLPTVGTLADRFGEAYGLSGSHRDWAYLSEQQIKQLIEPAIAAAGMPRPAVRQGPAPGAGLAGTGLAGTGHAGTGVPVGSAGAHLSGAHGAAVTGNLGGELGQGAPSAANPFAEDEQFVMGVPEGPPKGLFIAIGVIALLVVAGVAMALLL